MIVGSPEFERVDSRRGVEFQGGEGRIQGERGRIQVEAVEFQSRGVDFKVVRAECSLS